MFSYFPTASRSQGLRAWSPFQFDFDDVFSNARELTKFAPDFAIDEDEQHFLVSLDVPGVRKEDITIELEGNELVVIGERKWTDKAGKKLTEARRFGKFERRFSVPVGTRADGVEADVENGVLTIAIAKPEQLKKAKISITEGRPGGGGFLKRILGEKTEDAATKTAQN